MKKSAAATRLWSVGYFFIFTVVCAIQPEPPILGQGCALLKQHIIYCYGGATYTSDANNRHAKTHDTLYALDLQGTSTQVDSWRLVTPRGGSIGPNAAFAFAGLADDVHMIVHGGWGLNDGHTSLINQTGVFSAETENWEIIPMPKKTSPLSEMPAVLDMNKTVWIWSGQAAKGGDRESDVPEPENIRFFFNQQFVANRALFPANSYARLGHSAAFLAAEAAILYFGGLNQTWGIRPIASGVIPSARYFHTTTSVPGTSDIILYGGRAYGTDRPVDDFLRSWSSMGSYRTIVFSSFLVLIVTVLLRMISTLFV
ncbi:hypothetical protein BX666DRAFT_796910 [Dichotomocladium elegans]|nr:hypothetical protein BX666DRAFT_796910 [Dichotomocladium elegans]